VGLALPGALVIVATSFVIELASTETERRDAFNPAAAATAFTTLVRSEEDVSAAETFAIMDAIDAGLRLPPVAWTLAATSREKEMLTPDSPNNRRRRVPGTVFAGSEEPRRVIISVERSVSEVSSTFDVEMPADLPIEDRNGPATLG
jgi:hypothetical protein